MSERVSPAALDILASAAVEGQGVRLPSVTLERALYEEVNEVLVRLGGKWKKRGKAKDGVPQGTHEFPHDPAPLLSAVVETGEMPPKNPTAFFPTPAPIVAQMVEWAGLAWKDSECCRILEPSAGTGAIACAIRAAAPSARLDTVEVLPINAAMLRHQGFQPYEGDFLTWRPEYEYDAVLMNPPFSLDGDALAYITHIDHAWSLLRDGGELVAITPPSFTHRSDKRSKDFLARVGEYGEWADIEAGAFKESGTGIATRIVYMKKEDQSWKGRPFSGLPSWHVWAAHLWADSEREFHDARTRLYERMSAGTLADADKEIRTHFDAVVRHANQQGEGVRPTEADFAHLVADFRAGYDEWLAWQEEREGVVRPAAPAPAPLAIPALPHPALPQPDLFDALEAA